MTKITSFDLTPFYRNSVGVDSLFNRIVNQLDTAATSGNYPPYDIVKVKDDHYEIRIAAAGFLKGEIEVKYHEGMLTVLGRRSSDANPEVEYLHHGISNRDWARTFALADYVEVKDAVMQDGILNVKLERMIPESQKPKQIAITYAN